MNDDGPRLPLFTRMLIFLFFAVSSYGTYYLLAPKPLGFTFRSTSVATPAVPHPSPAPSPAKKESPHE